MQKILTTLFILLFTTVLFGNLPVKLNVQQQGSNYKLMWIPQSWNPTWQGVAIAYRPVGNTSWTYWNTEAIEPGISPQRVFSKQGVATATELALRVKFDYFMNANNLPPETFRNALVASPDGLMAREVMCMFDDFNCALSMGLGAVISVNTLVAIYEFALFPVLANGSMGPEMIGFHSMTDKGPQIIAQTTYTTQNLLNAIRIDWEIPASLAHEAKIFGFNIYKVDQGSVSLLHNHVGKLPGDNGNVYKYAYSFSTPQTSSGHTFILAPANYFKEELVHIQVEYTPQALEEVSKLVADFQLPVSNSMEGNPVINVNTHKLPTNTTSISIERYNPVAGAYRTIAQNLLPQTISWTDTELLEFGLSYTYRMVAITEDGKTVYSNIQTVVNLGSPKPAPVTNVTAELTRRGDQPYVRLRWQPLLHQRPPVKGYRILSNIYQQDVFTLHSDIPVITTNRYDFPLTGSFSNRNVTFQVVAITEYSQSGDIGGMVSISIPSLRLPAPQNLRLETKAQHEIAVSWDYDHPGDFLGFMLKQNGTQIADFSQIPASARTFTLQNLRPDNRGVIHLELIAVSSLAESPPARQSQRMPDHFLVPSLLQPQGISVAKVEIDGEVYAEFTWSGSPAGFGGRAFMLYADVHTPGHLSPMNSQPLMVHSPYRFKLPDPGRDVYLFEIRTMGEKNLRSPALPLSLRLN